MRRRHLLDLPGSPARLRSVRILGAMGLVACLPSSHALGYDCKNLHARLIVEKVNAHLETPAGGSLDCATDPTCVSDCQTDPIPNLTPIQDNVPEADGCLLLTADACAAEHLANAIASMGGEDDKPLQYRLAPLCEDGSGDHDWSEDPATGVAPTCAPEDYVTCVDGTRPVYWADPGIPAGNGHRKWIFRFQGSSGDCRKITRGTPLSAADRCWDVANGPDASQLSGLHEKKSLDEIGLLDPNGGVGFGSHNRVRISLCTQDRYAGDNQLVDQPLTDAGAVIEELNFRGVRLTRAVLQDLANSVTLGDGSFSVPRKVMPPLSQATDVLFAGSSAGAIGLTFTLDLLAQEVAGIAPATVRGLLDSRLMPSLDNEEAAFEDQVGIDDVYGSAGIAFDNPPMGNSDSGDWIFDSTHYLPGGGEAEAYGPESWKTPWHEDCLAVHGLNPPGSLDTQQWRCRDQAHLVMNHLRTPAFLAHSLRDSNQEDAIIEWAADIRTWQSLGTAYCDRQRAQLSDYAALRDAFADGGARGAGPIGVWAADFAWHEFFKGSGNDDCSFRTVQVGGTTLETALASWIGGTAVILIDGDPRMPGGAPATDPGTCIENAADLTCRPPCSTVVLPDEVSGPSSPEPLSFVDETTLAWEDGAASSSDWFNLYRGDVAALRTGSYGACGRSGLLDGTTSDAETPPIGLAWLYLVTGENCAGEGTMGSGAGGPRINANPCP